MGTQSLDCSGLCFVQSDDEGMPHVGGRVHGAPVVLNSRVRAVQGSQVQDRQSGSSHCRALPAPSPRPIPVPVPVPVAAAPLAVTVVTEIPLPVSLPVPRASFTITIPVARLPLCSRPLGLARRVISYRASSPIRISAQSRRLVVSISISHPVSRAIHGRHATHWSQGNHWLHAADVANIAAPATHHGLKVGRRHSHSRAPHLCHHLEPR